jgi:ADP-heptose:LPS heptosyltransferase
MKILVMSFAGIGDTLMATPLLHELRANFPEAAIDVLVRWGGSRDLLQGNPHVTTVLRNDLIKSGLFGALTFLRSVRRQRYDVSINTYPQSRIEYRLVARFIGASKRLSHIYDRWTLADRLLIRHAVRQDYNSHAVDNNLNLLSLLGVAPKLSHHNYELFLSADERKFAQQFLGDDARRILGIHVGSGTTKNLALRRWPIDSWVELIGRVLNECPQVRVFLFGGPDELEDHKTILGRLGTQRVTVPETKNFRHAAALLEKCHAFISVDTSLMHLAAAANVPNQFVIETPTFNKTVEPYGRPFTLIRNPMVAGRNLEYYRYDGKGIRGGPEHLAACMRSVTVTAVFEAIEPALNK